MSARHAPLCACVTMRACACVCVTRSVAFTFSLPPTSPACAPVLAVWAHPVDTFKAIRRVLYPSVSHNDLTATMGYVSADTGVKRRERAHVREGVRGGEVTVTKARVCAHVDCAAG